MNATVTLTAELIRDAVEGVDSWGSIRMYEGGYSGRGMYGKDCVAVVIDSISDAVALGGALAVQIACIADMSDGVYDALDGALDEFRGARSDSLGSDIVLYWPRIPALVA